MHARLLIVVAATIGLLGCRQTEPVKTHAVQKAAMAASRGAAAPSVVAAFLAGTWRWWPEPGSDECITIELSRDGRWRWAPSQQDASAPPEPQGGSWFVHEGTLVLRVEGGDTGQLPPGMAFTFNLKSLTAQQALMSIPGEVDDIVWERLAEPDDPANGSQPVR